jgi:phage-related protein
MSEIERQLFYVGSSQRDLKDLPDPVKEEFSLGFILALRGKQHPKAKPFKGFGGNSVLEIVEDHRSGTYRAIYTVKFPKAVYVLHVFQKKSKKGIETPKQDVWLIQERFKRAEADYKETFKEKK